MDAAAPPTLTPEQIRHFHEEGYLAVPQVTTAADVAFIREIYDRLFRERVGWQEGNSFDLAGTDAEGRELALPQLLGPAQYAPELKQCLLLANVHAMVKQLLGEAATCGIAHAIFKPAHHGAATPWHQDAAYWSPRHYHKMISVWVPLQEVTEANGCMQFVPRSHERDVLTHRSINNDPRIHGLELVPEELYQVKNPVVCPLPAGGATFHGGYMLHHTGPNHTDIPRRALILMGGVPGSERPLPRSYWWMDAKQTARVQRAAATKAAREAAAAAPAKS
jgi:ectoine hydroxylase-related dioxygenase (phytanoyl-CoA dioxygenase family)